MTSQRNLSRRRYPYGVLLDEPVRVDVAPAAGGPWRELQGVRDVRPTPLADRFAASTAAPLTVWQREKLRQAMQQALLLAKWVTHR